MIAAIADSKMQELRFRPQLRKQQTHTWTGRQTEKQFPHTQPSQQRQEDEHAKKHWKHKGIAAMLRCLGAAANVPYTLSLIPPGSTQPFATQQRLAVGSRSTARMRCIPSLRLNLGIQVHLAMLGT